MNKEKDMNLEYNIRGILHLFFRQQTKFLIVALGIFLLGFLATLNLKPYYNIDSSILLKFGQNARLEVNLQNTNTYHGGSYNERVEILQSNVEILKSVDLIKKALTKLEPDTPIDVAFPSLEEQDLTDAQKMQTASEQVQQNLYVFTGKDNYIIDITFRHDNPELAVKISQKLIEAFKDRHTEIYDTPQINFLEQQAQKAQNQLDQSREKFVNFKKETGVSEIDKEIEQLLRQKNELSAIAYRAVTEAQQSLAELEAKAAEMRATYRSDSPVMRSLRDSIAVARAQLKARQKDMVTSENVPLSIENIDIHEERMNDFKRFEEVLAQSNNEKKDGTFPSQIGTIDKRIAWLEAKRGKFNELEQQVKLDEENTKYYQQRMEEARVNSMLNDQDITRVTVIEEPRAPLRPSGPNKLFILIGVIMLSGVMASLTAIIFEVLDDRFSFPEQIRSKLGVPVLATFTKAEGM